MTAPDHVIQSLQALQAKLAQREEAVREMKLQINRFCEMFDMERPYADAEGDAPAEVSRGFSFRPDEFANHKSPGAAVRQLLQLRGKDRGAIQIEEAYRILRQYGYPFDHRASDDRALGGVRIAIGKDRHLVRHSNDSVGLAEWYPNRKKPKSGKSSEAEEAEEEATDDEGEEDEQPADDNKPKDK